MEPRARYQKNRPTSRAGAAHAQKSMGMKATAVLRCIIANDGASIAEVAHSLGCGSNAVTSSIAALRDDFGLIADSGEKRATVTACRGIVWRATEAGENALQNRADVLHAPSIAAPAADVTGQLPFSFPVK